MTKKTQFTNDEVVHELKEVLAAMTVKDVNRFRIRAYQNVITSIENITSNVYDLWEKNKLSEIQGIGTTLSGHLDELFSTGEVKDFIEMKADLPQGMFALLGLRGVGAKTAFKLASTFEINERENALELVKKAAEDDKISQLPGFGAKSQQDILDSISEAKMHKSEKKRLLLVHAEEISARIIGYMVKNDAVLKIDALGSQRRRESTVGDIDLAVSTENPEEVIQHFLEFDEIGDVLSKGKKKAAVVLKNDAQVDLRVSEPESYGAMLQYFTGSKMHNVLLRTYALEMGLSLSEYGIKKKGELTKVSDEEKFYKKLGLDYIPPEIRLGANEIELAAKQSLPELITLNDIKGDLHTHTTYSDGINTLEEMVNEAVKLGYQYIGISDHAPSVNTRGTYEVLGVITTRRKEIEQLNSSLNNIRVLFGYEINILTDGEISMPDELMEKLDYVICSIHTSFDQDKKTVTNRIINAIKNPYVDIIGHPSNRLINQRSPSDVDWDEVFSAAKEYNKIIEINSQPNRLDLADDLVRQAIGMGVKIIVNTDAHSVDNMYFMKYGIDVARRGMCENKDVVNTQDLSAFLKKLNIKS